MSVSLNVARAWAEASFTAGHQMGVENTDIPEVNIDDYRPKRGKKSVCSKKTSGSPKKVSMDSSSLPFDESRCDARVWNGGYGGQCSKAHAEGCRFCPLHEKQLEKSLASGGTDLRCGCWSKDRPSRTLDGKDEAIKWKDASEGDISKSVSKSGDHPKPRGPAPKSECGGKKVWNGEIGQWEDPALSGSDTEDMGDEDEVSKKVIEQKVVENLGDEKVVGGETIDGKYYEISESSKIIKNANGSETEIISTHFTEVESVVEEMEPEPEPEPEAEAVVEPEAAAVVEPEAEAVVEPEAEAVVEPEAEAVVEPEAKGVIAESSSTQRVVADELEADDVTYAPRSPRSDVDTQIDGDKLTHQGITYMFDEDDGMIYHSETYDDVGKYCTATMTLAWKSKKHEIAHLKEVTELGSK